MSRFSHMAEVSAAFACGGAMVVSMIPHTFLLKSQRRQLAAYRDGKEMPMNNHVTGMTKELMDMVLKKWTAASAANTKFFMCSGLEPLHRGSTATKPEAVVGIPTVYQSQSVEEIDHDLLPVSGCSVDWSGEVGQSLLNSLILSRDAKLFGIAREMNYAHTLWVQIEAGIAFVSTAMAYLTGRALNIVLRLPKRTSLPSRCVMYGLVSVAYFGVYSKFVDRYNYYLDRKVDKKTLDMGPAFWKGGEEFYSKQIASNIALRTLLGQEGSDRFTAAGNNKYAWYRTRHQPNTQRLAFVQKYRAEKLSLQTEKDTDESV